FGQGPDTYRYGRKEPKEQGTVRRTQGTGSGFRGRRSIPGPKCHDKPEELQGNFEKLQLFERLQVVVYKDRRNPRAWHHPEYPVYDGEKPFIYHDRAKRA